MRYFWTAPRIYDISRLRVNSLIQCNTCAVITDFMNPVQDRSANRNSGPAVPVGVPLILNGFTVADRSHYVHQAASCCSSVKIPDPNSVLGTTFLGAFVSKNCENPTFLLRLVCFLA